MKTFIPHQQLRDYIKSYNYVRIPHEGISNEMKFLPTGNPCLVVNLGSSYFVKNDDYHEVVREREGLIIGQQNKYYLLKPENDFAIFLIIFEPTGIYRLLNFPIFQIGNKSARLSELSDTQLNEWFVSLLDLPEDIENIVNLTDRFFLQRLKFVDNNHAYIDSAIKSIYLTNGFMTVKELAASANTSERNFRRRFFELVGIPPKKFILINRLHYILSRMQQNQQGLNWADVAYSCGYYDQMHFIKEFKKFSGETPHHYFNEQQKMQELYTSLFSKD